MKVNHISENDVSTLITVSRTFKKSAAVGTRVDIKPNAPESLGYMTFHYISSISSCGRHKKWRNKNNKGWKGIPRISYGHLQACMTLNSFLHPFVCAIRWH